MPPLKSPLEQVKKPRHRHSAVQLAALNSLFTETDGHPSLIQRTELAQNLGLEIKSVNAYFQNKRASSKKQPRGTPYDPPARPHLPPMDDDYHYPPPSSRDIYFRPPPLDQDPRSRHQSPFTDHSNWRLSPIHVDELRRYYRLNPYPTHEEVLAMAVRIALHHQIITDWFRTQRNLDRRSDYPHPAKERITLPPISSLPLPPASSQRSLVRRDDAYNPYSSRRSPSLPSVPSASQYSSTSTAALSLSSRQRRGRPDPFQLNSLRGLLSKTPTPSIEQRSALAHEIGMDLGKVTNWFRNLRQSARKRARGGAMENHTAGSDDDYGAGAVYLSSPSRSRSETPAPTSSVEHAGGEYAGARRRLQHSSDDDDEEEAVTPASSPPPSPNQTAEDGDQSKAQMQGSSVPYEDALLLLGFHRHAGVF